MSAPRPAACAQRAFSASQCRIPAHTRVWVDVVLTNQRKKLVMNDILDSNRLDQMVERFSQTIAKRTKITLQIREKALEAASNANGAEFRAAMLKFHTASRTLHDCRRLFDFFRLAMECDPLSNPAVADMLLDAWMTYEQDELYVTKCRPEAPLGQHKKRNRGHVLQPPT
jgi:hypothetical protein